jgi:hypothetical protein
VVRGHTLQGVCDEVSRAALRLRAGLLLRLTHPTRELVADQLLRTLQEVGLRLVDGHARDPLELVELRVARFLELLLELLRVHLAVGDALLTARELRELAVDVLLLADDTLLELQHLGAPVGHLLLDLRPEADRLLARLDLGLPPQRVGLAFGLGDEELPGAARGCEAGTCEGVQGEKGKAGAGSEADQYPDDQIHARSLSRAGVLAGREPIVRAGTRCPSSTACTGSCSNRGIGQGARRLAVTGHLTAAVCSPPSRSSWLVSRSRSDSETRLDAGKMSDVAWLS